MDKAQWKMVPIVPTQQMIDAWRTDQAHGRSLQTSYAAMLADAPQPPSASGEREAFEAWHLAGCEMVDDPASGRMDIAQHCAWQAWQARAALAPATASVIERLRIHAADERNTAFARSTMNELLAGIDGGNHG